MSSSPSCAISPRARRPVDTFDVGADRRDEETSRGKRLAARERGDARFRFVAARAPPRSITPHLIVSARIEKTPPF